MTKRPSHYYRPENLDEALRLLAQPDRVPLAGGTKLLAGDIATAVVDLQDLGLNQVDWRGNDLYVGATRTLANLAADLADRSDGPSDLLQKAIRQAGPNTYRNAATLGGVIASRLPDSELLAALLVLDATLNLQGANVSGMSLAAYLAADERPSGLITRIAIPWAAGQGHSARVARTPADYPIVSVTGWQPQDGLLRLAATGIRERPFRLTAAESHLSDGFNETAVAAAARAAKSACRHPGDFRGDADYRAEMTAVLTRRVCGYASLQVGG